MGILKNRTESFDDEEAEKPNRDWSDTWSVLVKEISKVLPTNLLFTDIRRLIYQPDSSKRVPNESEVSSWSLRDKCEMICERLMVNGLDEKFWYEPPSGWLEFFRILLENYVELIPKQVKTK